MTEQPQLTEQQQHLQSVITQSEELMKEIQELNNKLGMKRDMATKLQGIYEYLTGTGVKLPEEGEGLVEDYLVGGDSE